LAITHHYVLEEVQAVRADPERRVSAGFFTQVGVDASTTPAAAAAALQAAGDQMLQAVIFHSDKLELSESYWIVNPDPPSSSLDDDSGQPE
jgi:glucoamylase